MLWSCTSLPQEFLLHWTKNTQIHSTHPSVKPAFTEVRFPVEQLFYDCYLKDCRRLDLCPEAAVGVSSCWWQVHHLKNFPSSWSCWQSWVNMAVCYQAKGCLYAKAARNQQVYLQFCAVGVFVSARLRVKPMVGIKVIVLAHRLGKVWNRNKVPLTPRYVL